MKQPARPLPSPQRTRARPALLCAVLTAAAPTRKANGTHGYPGTRKGRGSAGSFVRNRTTPATAAACETDEQCRTGEICVESACRPARQRRISALFYFHQAGPRGYRMVVPFYFSLWSPRSQSRLLLPFFGDFRERERDGELGHGGLRPHATRSPDTTPRPADAAS